MLSASRVSVVVFVFALTALAACLEEEDVCAPGGFFLKCQCALASDAGDTRDSADAGDGDTDADAG
jgi:hypothetical protein